MQADQSPEPEPQSRSWFWIVVAGILSIFVVACGSGVALLIFNDSRPQLPTRVAAAQIEVPTVAGQVQAPDTTPVDEPVLEEVPVILTPQAGGRSAGDPYAPELGNTGYDTQHITIQLALDPADDFVQGATTLEAISQLPGLAEISLDFAGYDVGSVTVDGLAANFVRAEKKLIITLPEMKQAGQPFTVVVSYRGRPLYEPSPYLHFVDHLGLHYPDGQSLFIISEPDGARYWFPANDHSRDKATYRFEVAVPAGLTVVANGQLKSRAATALPNGEPGELFIWEHDYPMAPYLALVAVGLYERIDDRSPAGVPIRHYTFPELKDELNEVTGEIGAALDWMASLFGPYPFESFGFVTARIQGGSMESQTMVLLSDGMIGKRTAVHELAHMWFGDWVSLDSWQEMWRNEGFATYVQLMWETQDDPEELALQMAALESVVEGNDKSYPLNQPPPEYLFELNIYFQGALVVHALRQEVGDAAFFQGLRTYFERYGGGTASDAQFKEVMEQAAGRPLDDFFAEWFGG